MNSEYQDQFEPEDNIGGVDEDANFVEAESTGYEDIENDSEDDSNEDW